MEAEAFRRSALSPIASILLRCREQRVGANCSHMHCSKTPSHQKQTQLDPIFDLEHRNHRCHCNHGGAE
jgi:hypothetical protein